MLNQNPANYAFYNINYHGTTRSVRYQPNKMQTNTCKLKINSIQMTKALPHFDMVDERVDGSGQAALNTIVPTNATTLLDLYYKLI